MDAFQYINNRHIELDNLFSADNQPTAEDNYDKVMIALSNALEKQLRTWWDINTIEHYLKKKIIIRSLRWEVTPLDGLDDLESMNEWLGFFNGVGLKLQDLILQRKKRK